MRAAIAEPLDLELWHPGDRQACSEVLDLLGHTYAETLHITDRYVGDALCIARIVTDLATVEQLLQLDWIKQIDRLPEPVFVMDALVDVRLRDLGDVPVPPAGAPGVLIIDSGVMAGHPLLAPALGDAQHFLATADQAGTDDGDTEGGHGTGVAGIAMYGDVAACLVAGTFEPQLRLFSARVTTNGTSYDPGLLIESQLRRAVEYFSNRYPESRVINLSLGDRDSVLTDGMLQMRLAAVVDELAYEFRDRELVFVVSAGNYIHLAPADEVVATYPDYLLTPEARVIDPATACLAITVGSLSGGAGTPAGEGVVADWPVAGHRAWPSPFTRTGLGLGGSNKPDLVDFGGDLRLANQRIADAPAHVGIPTTSRFFGPPEGRLLTTKVGTSFSAPRVAHAAARIFAAFPQASSNLVRALLASAATVPESRPPQFLGIADTSEPIRRVYGSGLVNLESALTSADNRVLLVDDATLLMDHFLLYEVPPLPDEFYSVRGTGTLSVTLAFDPPTRATRADDYMGVRMEFGLFKNATPAEVADAIRVWDRVAATDDAAPRLGDIHGRVNLLPGPTVRGRSALQKGTARMQRRGGDAGAPLVLAIVCARRWAPATVRDQRFAVVVTVEHDSETVDLYGPMAARNRVPVRERVRVTR